MNKEELLKIFTLLSQEDLDMLLASNLLQKVDSAQELHDHLAYLNESVLYQGTVYTVKGLEIKQRELNLILRSDTGVDCRMFASNVMLLENYKMFLLPEQTYIHREKTITVFCGMLMDGLLYFGYKPVGTHRVIFDRNFVFSRTYW